MAVNNATTFLLVGALISGVGAAYLTDNYISGEVNAYKVSLDKNYEPVKVIVPKDNLRSGDMLTYENLAVRSVPREFVHSESVRPEDVEAITGHRLVHPINEGEPVLLSYIAKKRGAGFSNLIEKGKRALTFPVDMVSSVSGHLRPGDRIDLLVTLQDENDSVTIPLLRNVSILATGRAVDEHSQSDDINGYQTITLMVSPKDAAKITHARDAGTMTVVLRSPDDKNLAFNQRITKASLIGKSKADKDAVEIILGGN